MRGAGPATADLSITGQPHSAGSAASAEGSCRENARAMSSAAWRSSSVRAEVSRRVNSSSLAR